MTCPFVIERQVCYAAALAADDVGMRRRVGVEPHQTLGVNETDEQSGVGQSLQVLVQSSRADLVAAPAEDSPESFGTKVFIAVPEPGEDETAGPRWPQSAAAQQFGDVMGVGLQYSHYTGQWRALPVRQRRAV